MHCNLTFADLQRLYIRTLRLSYSNTDLEVFFNVFTFCIHFDQSGKSAAYIDYVKDL